MHVKESVAFITFTYLVNELITSKCIKTRSNITYREIVIIQNNDKKNGKEDEIS